MSGLSIAITIDNTHEFERMLYGNGIAQNIKFLYDLLKILGHEPYLMGVRNVPNDELVIANKKYKLMRLTDVSEKNLHTDLILEVGVSINTASRNALKKRFGTRTICVRYGHTMFMDMEQICHKETLPPGIYVNNPEMVWASPHFEKSFSYLETVYSAPVETVPYIWEPDLVEKPFGKKNVKETPDLYVMEPNMSVLKNALIPMAIIERLYRDSPQSFNRAVIVNGTKFNSGKFFLENIVRHMPALGSKSNKVFFAKRAPFNRVFRQRDILLGHQHECELNYLYLEALHKNVPLVHNSPAFKSAGYYYPEFRVDLGVAELKKAISDHNVDRYRANAKALIYSYSIHNPKVQQAYVELLDKTMAT